MYAITIWPAYRQILLAYPPKKWVILGYDETPLIEKERSTIASVLKEKRLRHGLFWEMASGHELADKKRVCNSE
jgi:hypothetical protein